MLDTFVTFHVPPGKTANLSSWVTKDAREQAHQTTPESVG